MCAWARFVSLTCASANVRSVSNCMQISDGFSVAVDSGPGTGIAPADFFDSSRPRTCSSKHSNRNRAVAEGNYLSWNRPVA